MSKVRLYIEPDKVSKIVKMEERSLVHKIKDVLRLGIDDKLYIFDGQGKEYLYQIKEITKKLIRLEQGKLQRQEKSPKKELTLGFPLIGEGRVDFILQKCTELGVSGFIPFVCERSARVKSAKKLDRWKRIIIEATRQSERLWIPSLSNILEFDQLPKLNYKVKLAGFINGEPVEKISGLGKEDIFIAIGPVGDFSPNEYERLKESGFRFIKLAPNLLRVETAAMVSVGLVRYFLDKK